MRSHPSSAEVQEAAALAVNNMCHNNDANRAEAGRLGLLEAREAEQQRLVKALDESTSERQKELQRVLEENKRLVAEREQKMREVGQQRAAAEEKERRQREEQARQVNADAPRRQRL